MILYFNPHPREGGDYPAGMGQACRLNFNPHPREGGDHQPTTKGATIDNFNPHPREGGDLMCPGTPIRCNISIHTPAKGVTARFVGWISV